MSITAKQVSQLIDTELEFVSDVRVIDHVRSLLVAPQIVQRFWNYGEPDTKYPCWSVLQHESSNTEIAYSEFGFGPTYPWGLVFMSGSEDEMAMGMDSAWFPCFMEAYFESKAACELPIWRVFSRVGGTFPAFKYCPGTGRRGSQDSRHQP